MCIRDRIQTQSERFRFMTGNISNNRLEDTFREHIDIIIPCLQKDWDTAVEKLLYHLDESKRSTFKLVFDSIDTVSYTHLDVYKRQPWILP